jgi:PKD repeat protein
VTAGANAIAGNATTFTITAAPAPGSNTTIQKVLVTFGDGAAPVDLGAVSGSTTTQHVYAASGTYTVSATATASSGGTASASSQVVVAPRPSPSVSISAGANPVTSRATTFTITTAPAPATNAAIQSVQVNFGDLTPPANLGAVSGTATTQHVYAAPGTYAVSATATDSGGATATANTSVVVVAAAAVTLTPSANPVAAVPMQFTLTVTPSTGVSIQNAVLRYGDGAQDDLGVVSGAPVVKAHTYAAAGTFAASAIVTIVGGTTPLTTSATVVVAACSVLAHTFSIDSVQVGLLFAWPGGTQTFVSGPTCSVTIRAPSDLISNLGGDTWGLVSAVGYSICSIRAQVPTCRGLGSGASLLPNGRPVCSNSSIVGSGGASTATLDVSCTP